MCCMKLYCLFLLRLILNVCLRHWSTRKRTWTRWTLIISRCRRRASCQRISRYVYSWFIAIVTEQTISRLRAGVILGGNYSREFCVSHDLFVLECCHRHVLWLSTAFHVFVILVHGMLCKHDIYCAYESAPYIIHFTLTVVL